MNRNEYVDTLLYPASIDVAAVESLIKDDGINMVPGVIAYHSQQAAEKMVKAALEQSGIVPPFTHRVDQLMGKLADAGLAEFTADEIVAASSLTGYEATARYSRSPDIDAADAQRSIIECNVIAAMLERNGFVGIYIDTNLHFLHDESMNTQAHTEDSLPEHNCSAVSNAERSVTDKGSISLQHFNQ